MRDAAKKISWKNNEKHETEKSLTDSFLSPSPSETESDSEKTVKIKKRSNAYGKTRIRTVLNEKQLHTLRYVEESFIAAEIKCRYEMQQITFKNGFLTNLRFHIFTHVRIQIFWFTFGCPFLSNVEKIVEILWIVEKRRLLIC